MEIARGEGLRSAQLGKSSLLLLLHDFPARILSNGGVLAGNKLMSRSMGGAHCYVRPPLINMCMKFRYLNFHTTVPVDQLRKHSKKLFVLILNIDV